MTRYIPHIMAAGLIVLGFWYHGSVQYNKGSTQCENSALNDTLEANNSAVKEKVQNEKKFQTMPVSDIDSYGVSRGWVRSDSDR